MSSEVHSIRTRGSGGTRPTTSFMRTGTIPGSELVYVPDVLDADVVFETDRPVWILCETGFRAGIAAWSLASWGRGTVVPAGAAVEEVQRRMIEDG